MEKKTGNLLFAVVIMQAVGLICLCVIKYNMDVFSMNYRTREEKTYAAILSLREVSGEIYRHESLVAMSVLGTDEDVIEVNIEKAEQSRERIEYLMVECDSQLRGLSSFDDYQSLENINASIKSYLTSAESYFAMYEKYSGEEALEYFNRTLNVYIQETNSRLDILSAAMQQNLSVVQESMRQSIQQSRLNFVVGVIVFFLATILCLWYCRRMLRQQEIYMDAAQSASRAKSSFLSSMSHEIRTPINAILGMNEMIQRESDDAEILGYSQKISSAGNGLLGLVNDILDFSKIEAGKMELVETEYRLDSMLSDVWNMLYLRASEKGLTMSFYINPNIPNRLNGDSVRIRQIIVNLLTNAVKYTPKGSVSLKLAFDMLSDSQITLKVAVTDTGIGINPEEIEKLTKPFERIDEKKTKNIEGTGLGLSIVNNLLYLMDSKLEVSSVYGEGSTFSFEIAQQVAGWEKIGHFKPEESRQQDNGENEQSFTASRAHILAVDDNEMNRMVIKELLKRTLIQLDIAEGGRQSVEMAAATKYDLILMDHRMPEIDGVEALHLIQKEGANKETPVIVVTANALSGAEEEYRAEGFADCLKKPINGKQLEDMIRKYLPSGLIDSEEEAACLIDEAAGIKASGSKELYIKVLEEFAASAGSVAEELRSLRDTQNIKDYTIKVHALKSAARLAGATALSEEAKHLEECGDAGNLKEIELRTEELLLHLSQVTARIQEMYSIEEAHPNGMISRELLEQLLMVMEECSSVYDFDSVDRAVEELDKYDLPESVKDYRAQLKKASYEINQEQLTQLIGRIREGICE